MNLPKHANGLGRFGTTVPYRAIARFLPAGLHIPIANVRKTVPVVVGKKAKPVPTEYHKGPLKLVGALPDTVVLQWADGQVIVLGAANLTAVVSRWGFLSNGAHAAQQDQHRYHSDVRAELIDAMFEALEGCPVAGAGLDDLKIVRVKGDAPYYEAVVAEIFRQAQVAQQQTFIAFGDTFNAMLKEG